MNYHPDYCPVVRERLQESNSQGRHTFFEVVLGGLFARSQYGPRYEQNIDGLTPDWVLTNEPYCAIVEVVSIDPSAEVTKKLNNERIEYDGDRAVTLYDAIRKKKVTYQNVIDRKNLPFVIAVCLSLATSLRDEQLIDTLQNAKYGIFNDSPHVSGVLYFQSRVPLSTSSYAEHWHYYYCANPNARMPWKNIF